MIYLTLPELLHAGRRYFGEEVPIRDAGLLESALARPQAGFLGVDVYPTLEEKAAALLHSTVRNDALIDGNKRLGLIAVIAFLGMNGRRLTLTNDEAYDLVIGVSTGELENVPEIAELIRRGSGRMGA